MRFQTDQRYVDRKTKAGYVWDKYGALLQGRVLDVGGDDGHIRAHLAAGTDYVGVDLFGRPGVLEVNLEKQRIPVEDGAFNTVMCLDVLEHLDNFYEVFGELCRVTSRWLILALPNPYADFYLHLIQVGHRRGEGLQHYGLPGVAPKDRHKWFYAASQAQALVERLAAAQGMAVVQHDAESQPPLRRVPRSLADLARWKTRVLEWLLLPAATCWSDLHDGTQWWVLEKAAGAASAGGAAETGSVRGLG